MKNKSIRPTTIIMACLGTAAWTQAASIVKFASTNYTVLENAGAVTLNVLRTGDNDTVISVDYASTNLTATPDLDYSDVAGTLVFAAGQTNQSITVPILNDGLVEITERFEVILSNPTNALLGVSMATVSITDNDTGFQFESVSYSIDEDAGFVLIGVTRGDDGTLPISVDFATTNLSAIAGSDYMPTNGTLFFAGGERVRLFTVPILNNGLKDSNRKFRVTLSNPTNHVLGTQTNTTVTIRDNDPGVQIAGSVSVQDTDGAATVTVVRGNDMALGPFTVGYATSDGTATAGVNYSATSGTMVFAQGEMAKTITVPIQDHGQLGNDERFTLGLNNPSSGVVLGPNATVTITILDTTGLAAHRFDRITVQSDRSVQLLLGGGVPLRFRPFFDLYPIEVSSNLMDWAPLATLVRTNVSTNILSYLDTEAMGAETRFYRTAATNLQALSAGPTGPFTVGIVDRVLMDPSQRNRYGISTNTLFMATFWYPAQAKAGLLPAPMMDPGVAPYWFGIPTVLASRFHQQAYLGCPLATNRPTYPVLVYSCGGASIRNDNSVLALELASHGYIVVSAEHADDAAMRLPDGRLVFGTRLADSVPTYQSRNQDFRVLLAELETMNASDTVFGHRLALDQLGVFGLTSGGVATAQLCFEDDRVKAAVFLDAGSISYVPNLLYSGIRRPFLAISGVIFDGRQLFDRATGSAYWLSITGADHGTLTDWPLYSAPTIPARRASQILQAYTLSFFNKHLLNRDDHLLDGPSPLYPEVPTLLRK